MRKLLATLLSLVGASGSAQPQPKVQNIDPKTILFSIPTLSDDIAPLEKIEQATNELALTFHEDYWSQIEFISKERLPEIQRMLKEYKEFEQGQRLQSGWRNAYIRKLPRQPLVTGAQPVRQLENILGLKAGPAPILYASSTVGGRVKDGFTFSLGGNVTLYGYNTAQGVPVLGASVGQNPDDSKLTQAFIKLNSSSNLMLVDWRFQLLLLGVSKSGQIEVWKP